MQTPFQFIVRKVHLLCSCSSKKEVWKSFKCTPLPSHFHAGHMLFMSLSGRNALEVSFTLPVDCRAFPESSERVSLKRFERQ